MAKLDFSCCAEAQTLEYWHEHKDCGDEMCYAIECETCSKWETLCGMKG